MQACPEQECDEILNVPIPNASANPRAVMIVDLNAHAALAAVERSRWPQMLASVTIAQLIVSLPWLNVAMLEHVSALNLLLMTSSWQVLELVETVVLVYRLPQVQHVHRLVQLLTIFVLHVVLLMGVDLLDFNILDLGVHEDAGEDAWFRE